MLATGKSSLVVQYVDHTFVDSYFPTIENTFSKSIKCNGVDYDCDIIDTAGQVRDRFRLRRLPMLSLTLRRTSSQSSIPSTPSAYTALCWYTALQIDSPLT